MGTDTESPSGTIIRDYNDAPIIDAHGVPWAISRSGQVVVDGEHDRRTRGVVEIAYINRLIWQWTTDRLWWSTTGPNAPWLPAGGTPNAPFGPTPDPRIDTLQAAIDALSGQVQQAAGTLAAELDDIKAGVRRISHQIQPDDRIDALIGAMAALAVQISTTQAETDTRLDTFGNAILDTMRADRAALRAAEQTIALMDDRQATMAGQLDRVVAMLLDLFPTPAKRRIVAHMDTARSEGSQPVPDGH